MFVTISVFIGAVWAIINLIGKYNELYWKNRGVPFYTKSRVFGPLGEFVTTDRALFEIFKNLYRMYPDEPAVGVGSLLTPALYVKDPTNVQFVLQSGFNFFNHRGFDINEGDLLGDNILLMNGNRWKLMRQSMTPLFTSSKLKSMYYIMDKSARDFVKFLKDNPEKLKGDAFNTLSTFCSAAIGAAVFGIGVESVFDSPFLDMAQKAMRSTTKQNIQFALASLSNKLFKILDIKIFKDYEKFFIGAIKQVIRQREIEDVKKHDFADICVNLQKAGILKDNDTGCELVPSDELLAAQAFFFFVAGVEPTATSIFSTIVELGRNPEALQKIHHEIDEAFDKHEGKITSDIVNEMEYLEMVFNEAMRMYPPIGFLTRQCVHNTVLPVGNIRVDKGTKLFTPIFEIHHDPKLFPEPETFNPERFSSENRKTIGDNFFMPFGKGNRLCLGMRYATLQAKSGLVHLLRNFTVKTHIHEGGIKYSKQSVQVRACNVDVEFIPR